MLRLVHLSDIHFGGYGPIWDEDEDQREQLVVDVGELIPDGKSADGILIGGDVAYSGKREQYDTAKQWLDDLIESSGSPRSAVWAVPGNHDVDRDIVSNSHILSDFRKAVRGCELPELDELLRDRLAKDSAGFGLVQPFEAYNEFALGWGCATSSHSVHWEDETLRIGATPVLLWGLNSALVSYPNDAGGEIGDPNLVLGTYQSKVKALPNEIRIVLCHHPPSWLRDWEKVAPYLARADLVLFGHEHSYAAYQPQAHQTVHVYAGAVGPERDAKWVPTYNLLTMDIEGDDLHVAIQPRVWSQADTRFIAHHLERQEFVVALDRRRLTRVDTPAESGLPEPAEPGEEPAAATPLAPKPPRAGDEPAAPPEPVDDPARLRALAVAYLSAPVTRRLEIAQKLGVLHAEDLDLPDDRARYAAVLSRIRDSDLIDELAKELDI